MVKVLAKETKPQLEPVMAAYRKIVMALFVLLVIGCSPAAGDDVEGIIVERAITAPATSPPEPAGGANQLASDVPNNTPPVEETPRTIDRLTVWVSPAAPQQLQSQIQWGDDLARVANAQTADLRLVVLPASESPPSRYATWWYALVAPFPTILDDVTMVDLQAAWRGTPPAHLAGWTIYMEESTRLAFQAVWGPVDRRVGQVAAAADILDMAWAERPSLALVPFEQLDPRWKIIRVDGLSPLDADLQQEDYPLALRFGLRSRVGVQFESHAILASIALPDSNVDPSRMTTLIMTGVTALVRSTALRMEERGVLYPALDVGMILNTADITHISNEVPFYDRCPPAQPLRESMRFCSDPRYIQLLQAVGADVVELTGNHLLDWGQEAFIFTLDLYQKSNMDYFGGGYDLDDARRPLLVEHNGNRLAFLGCNTIGPETVFATSNSAGAAPCDGDWMVSKIQSLVAQGYLPIVTFQSIEVDDPRPHSSQRADSLQMAEAGAIIVSGSQAHLPQAMAFFDNRFIHYGLGNLFFDQMAAWQRPQFIDRHVFYDGRYIHAELITTMLEDSARPRLMNDEERQSLLLRIFEVSGW